MPARPKSELFARGALDTAVAGLQQEIANGSTTTTIAGTPIYTPSYSTNIAPIQAILNSTLALAPLSAGTGQTTVMPSLIRESGRGESATLPANAVPSNASACNSTTTVSANGRNINLARWNAHYLLQRFNTTANPSTTYDDRTPSSSVPKGVYNPNTAFTGGFMPPDWVFVTKDEGPVVLSTPNVDSKGNPVTTIGRYAYAIYDEGALLDANVAGCPAITATLPPAYAPKGTLAFADLTRLPTESVNGNVDAGVHQHPDWLAELRLDAESLWDNANRQLCGCVHLYRHRLPYQLPDHGFAQRDRSGSD